jgi:hypothetical protein
MFIDGILGFLGISKIQLIIAAVALVAMLGLAGTCWFLWNQNQDLNKDLGAANLTIQTMAEVIEQKKLDAAEIVAANEALNKAKARNQEKIENLEIKLNALKLAKSAIENPPATQIIVNKLLKDQNRCIELTTGALTTTEEKNELCPELLPQVKP